MSIEAWKAVLEADIDDGPMKAVLMGVANHAGPEGKNIYPSVKRIAIYCGFSEATVQRKLAKAVNMKILRMVAEARQYRPREYEMDIALLEDMRSVELDQLLAKHNQGSQSEAPQSATRTVIKEDSVGSSSVGESSKTKESSIDSRLKSSNGRKLTQSQLWVKVLCEICKMDPDVMAGRVAKRAKNLRDAGYTLEQIERLYAKGGWWYRYDFRGKKGQPPVPEQIEKTILRALDEEVRLAKANKKGDMVAQ